ncbi:aminoglycoside phosphotransferase family protein [Novosphingobium sp. G106]|uniref:aminoglycoside phosphotransferase family protein n=1 Tax=Novosphingobium sp. G106 TaxID=2849500 RepID=UPI0035C8249C
MTAPRSTICKIGRPANGMLSATSPFERERNAFGLFGKSPPFRIPRLYFGAGDETGLCNLLLEDLSGMARAGDQIAGCSIPEAAAVVGELARFHRAYLASTDVFGLDWLTRPERLLPACAKGASVLRDWLGNRLSPEALDVVDRFAGLAGQWLARPPARRTLIHGDARVDNILFEERPEGLGACLIDWQSLGAGDPQYDVAYFLSGSLSPEDRRSCERDLIAEHCRLVAETDPTYTLEAALESYRRNIVSGLWMTMIAAAYVERTEHNAELLCTLVARNTAAVSDWHGLAAIG